MRYQKQNACQDRPHDARDAGFFGAAAEPSKMLKGKHADPTLSTAHFTVLDSILVRLSNTLTVPMLLYHYTPIYTDSGTDCGKMYFEIENDKCQSKRRTHTSTNDSL